MPSAGTETPAVPSLLTAPALREAPEPETFLGGRRGGRLGGRALGAAAIFLGASVYGGGVLPSASSLLVGGLGKFCVERPVVFMR